MYGDLLGKDNGDMEVSIPDTKLARERASKEHERDRLEIENDEAHDAFGHFMKVLAEHNMDGNSTINKQELVNALKNENLTGEYVKLHLFPEATSLDSAFDSLDVNNDGVIDYHELVRFAEKMGVYLQNKFISYDRRDINSLGDYVSTLIETQSINLKRLYFTAKDVDRSIGIDTGYLPTLNFDLETDDKIYAIQQGMAATRGFLKSYIKKNELHSNNE